MALDTGQREQDRMWLKRMSSQKADIIKLIICVGGAVFLLSYLLNTLGKRPELKDEKVHVAPMVIKKDSLPFERRGEEEVIEAQGGFPYGEEVLEKINHKNRYLEPEAYYYLANEVMKRPQEQLRDEANREVTWSDVFVDPQKYQGTTLAITGSLARIREAPLQANPCGLKSVYQGQLIDKDWRFWTFILIERPDKSFQDGDLVRVYGKFFKIWEYETNLPNTSKLNAVIVGKRFVHVELNKDPIAGWYIVGLAAATVLVLTVAQIISKKSDRHVDTIRKAKAQKKRPGGINDMARALSAKAANEQEAALIANREALRKKYMPEPELTDRDKMGEDDETHREETGSLNEEDDSKSGLEEEEVEAEKDEELNSQLEDEDQAGDDDEDDDGNAAKNEG